MVVDPVFGATAGGWRADPEWPSAYREHLLPLRPVLTPNLPELELLGGSAPALLTDGCRAVLLKGGHGNGDRATDVLFTEQGEVSSHHDRLDIGEVHGTGCALATSLACRLPRMELEAACGEAITHVQRCLLAAIPSEDGLPAHLAIVP